MMMPYHFEIGFWLRDLRPWWRFHPDDGYLYNVVYPDRWGDYLTFTALSFPA